jgi:hypothetical protein
MAMLARFKCLVVPIMLGTLVGFLVSYLLRPRYSARAVLEEIPSSQFDRSGLDKSASQPKLATYLEQALALNNLLPFVEREGIAKTGEAKQVYQRIRKNTKLENPVGGDSGFPDLRIDLVYTDSTPELAEQLCSVLTAAIERKTTSNGAGLNGLGQIPTPYGVGVLLPCSTSGIPVFPNRFLCSAIGSATGLLLGISLIALRGKSLGDVAKSHC